MATAAASPDAGLVRRLHERDRGAWEELYSVYAPRLRAFALRLTGSAHDADDLVQETFVRALPRLDRLDPDTVDVRAYLFTTLRNTFLKGVERGRRVDTVEQVPEPREPGPVEVDPARSALLRRQREEVRIAGARLAPRQRLALSLRELEDCSYAQIGAILELNENAVAQLISRARDTLRTEMRLGQVDATRLPEECRLLLPSLSRHLDGHLRGEALERTLAHLGSCELCRAALDAMREASRRYRALLPPVVGAEEALAAAIDARLTASGYWRGPRAPLARRRSFRAALAGLAALLVVVSGVTGAPLGSGERTDLSGAPRATAASDVQRPAAGPTAPVTTGTPTGGSNRPARDRKLEARPERRDARDPRPAQRRRPATGRRPTRGATKAKPRRAAGGDRPETPQPAGPDARPAPAPPADATPPTVTITAASTSGDRAEFSFVASEADVVFTCALDGGAFRECTSPTAYGGLSPGRHAFAVRARDGAGNTGAAAEHAWTVARALPDLLVSELTGSSVTVTNAGEAPAGRFTVAVTPIGTFTFTGLAPGQSATRTWSRCHRGTLTAVADREGVVEESDESNNSRSLASRC